MYKSCFFCNSKYLVDWYEQKAIPVQSRILKVLLNVSIFIKFLYAFKCINFNTLLSTFFAFNFNNVSFIAVIIRCTAIRVVRVFPYMMSVIAVSFHYLFSSTNF